MSEPSGWLSRLRQGLRHSSSALADRLGGILTRRRLDAEALEELEEALILSDLGVDVARDVVKRIAKDRFDREVGQLEIREALAQEIAAGLEPFALPLPRRDEMKPQVVLVCGVNGTGKTTTVGKMARQAKDAGLEVMLAACDTFRAAATDQLEVWAQRNDVPVISGEPGADAAGLAFDAMTWAKDTGADLLLIDTAGRLHNKQGLMDELRKVVRVVKKLDPSAPHDTLLILDATTGQNALAQVEVFKEMVAVSGLVVTKLDGTARGGVVVALTRRFGLPVHAVGVGEAIDDLRPFEAKAFAKALLGLVGPTA